MLDPIHVWTRTVRTGMLRVRTTFRIAVDFVLRPRALPVPAKRALCTGRRLVAASLAEHLHPVNSYEGDHA